MNIKTVLSISSTCAFALALSTGTASCDSKKRDTHGSKNADMENFIRPDALTALAEAGMVKSDGGWMPSVSAPEVSDSRDGIVWLRKIPSRGTNRGLKEKHEWRQS